MDDKEKLEPCMTELQRCEIRLKEYEAELKRYEKWVIGFQSLVDLAIFGIKSLILVNGGAILALLTFFGNSLSHLKKPLTGISWVFWWYFCGLSVALFCLLMTYVFQTFELECKQNKKHGQSVSNLLRGIAFICAVISLGCFIWGSLKAVEIFEAISKAS